LDIFSASLFATAAWIYIRSLPEALPIWRIVRQVQPAANADLQHVAAHVGQRPPPLFGQTRPRHAPVHDPGENIARIRTHRLKPRSEEHPSELQSRENIVCRVLLDRKKAS